MGTRYLFGAEVNRIQETLFAASLQRQVVGGSRLLAVFSEEGARLAGLAFGVADNDVVVKAGGTFRIIFDEIEHATAFGEQIANAYHLILDGAMTVAPPQPFDDALPVCQSGELGETACRTRDLKCFSCADALLGERLNDMKVAQAGTAVTQPHAPTTAFCTSSGVGLAEDEVEVVQNDPDSLQYVSGPAFRMKEVGFVTKPGDRKPQEARDYDFLGPIQDEIRLETAAHPVYSDPRRTKWARTPEDIARWDPAQRNVAYLVADGNNMGAFFSHCRDKAQRQALSQGLVTVVNQAIAAPIAALTERLYGSEHARSDDPIELPLLPLIAAGDDVFILLPAPYALDYARQFCQTFTEKMNALPVVHALQKAHKEKHQEEDSAELPPITMSAGVVFCKQSYPYNLAHEYGETLLARTKRVVKTVGREGGEWLSAVSFDVIIGSAGSSGRQYGGAFRPTLTTYWTETPASEAGLAALTAVPLQTLLDERQNLMELPGKRRAELRALFDAPPAVAATEPDREFPETDQRHVDRWNRQFARLLRRIKSTYPEVYPRLLDALARLGSADSAASTGPAAWRKRTVGNEQLFLHGLPDLFAVWPYAQSLQVDLGEYR